MTDRLSVEKRKRKEDESIPEKTLKQSKHDTESSIPEKEIETKRDKEEEAWILKRFRESTQYPKMLKCCADGDEDRPTVAEMEDDFLQQYRKDWDSLSDEQKFVVKQVRAGRNILNTGPGGTGKSFVIHFLGKYILNRMVDHIVAFMGTVAVQIKCATIHGFFKINPNVHSPERVVKTLTPDIRQKIRTMSSLRIDEVGQVSAELFDMVEQICRMVRNKPDLPAGGIQFVTFGDFLQLPPVNDHDKLVFTSNAWQRMSFVTVELT